MNKLREIKLAKRMIDRKRGHINISYFGYRIPATESMLRVAEAVVFRLIDRFQLRMASITKLHSGWMFVSMFNSVSIMDIYNNENEVRIKYRSDLPYEDFYYGKFDSAFFWENLENALKTALNIK